jgi:hypothetical protein
MPIEIKKALELLEQYKQEEKSLREIKYDNDAFKLWLDKVNTVIQAAFGKDSDEYEKFNPPDYFTYDIDLHVDKQMNYSEILRRHELGIQSILQKYEILGVPESTKITPDIEGIIVTEDEQPKAFIVHGGVQSVISKMKEFLLALDIQPIVVEEQPNAGMALDDKVEFYLNKADCAIILATADDDIKGKFYPRHNVSHEIGLTQKTIPDKIIYLLAECAEFPTNISPKVWERFNPENMEVAFTRVAKELKSFGIIKAVKPEG